LNELISKNWENACPNYKQKLQIEYEKERQEWQKEMEEYKEKYGIEVC